MDYHIRQRLNQAGETRYAVDLEVWVKGERKTITGGTHDTERDAIRAGEKLLLKYEKDDEKVKALRGNMPLSEWAEEYLADLTVKETSKNSYRWRMRHWVLPDLGDVLLKDLTAPVIDDWINGSSLARLSKESKKEALSILRCCLRKAVRRSILTSNPARDITLDMTAAQKKAEKERKRVKTWTYQEVEALLDAALGTRIEPVVVLGLLAGLRPGEAMATRWCDLSWASGRVTVGRTQSRNDRFRTVISDSTKSGETREPRLLFDASFRLMRIQEALEAKGPIDPQERLYPYLGSNSTPWRQMKALCKKAGVKPLSPHCLRHTHASLLLENGATSAAVAKQLGHSNPNITRAVYWHLIDDEDDTLSGVMDRALSKGPNLTEPSLNTMTPAEPAEAESDGV